MLPYPRFTGQGEYAPGRKVHCWSGFAENACCNYEILFKDLTFRGKDSWRGLCQQLNLEQGIVATIAPAVEELHLCHDSLLGWLVHPPARWPRPARQDHAFCPS